MGVIDKFLNAIRLNDDYDDDEDFLDDEDGSDEDLDEWQEKTKKKRFFSRFSQDEEDDLDDLDDVPQKVTKSEKSSGDRKTASISRNRTSSRKSADRYGSSYSADTARPVSYSGRTSSREERSASQEARKKQQKVTQIRRKNAGSSMEVNVIRPSSMEDTSAIADTLLQNCTVVLNLEGLDVDIAQRVIDFTCGVCYSLRGNLQKISSYIFILTPENVEISGDYQSILTGAFDLAPMRSTI